MKRLLIWILCLLILTQIAYAGVTNPLPTELNLLQGESGRFKFQIQTITSNQEVECSYALAEESPLIIEFDPNIIIVPAGSVREIRGSVTVPEDVAFGTYEEEFCISCRPTEGTAGSSVQIETCGLPIKVNVVAQRTRENMYIPLKEEQPPMIGTLLIAAGIIVLLGILIAILLYCRMKRKAGAKTAEPEKVSKGNKKK